jgi:glycosyltransferase involved in cell wall biosynthesis
VTPPPTVSVLVTTYNHADFVWECLDSLRLQTFRDFEVIITDDASPDGTADRIAAWLSQHALPARFLRNETNRGLCANRNTALALARGRFVCSLAGDDAYEPERLERQVACFLREPPDVALVYSDMRRVDAAGRDLGASFIEIEFGDEPPPEGDVFARLMRGCFVPSPAAMVRKSAFDSVGPYDESLFYEDFDMWLRLSHRYRLRYLPDRLVRYRVLVDSMSHSLGLRPRLLESTARILQSWEGRAGAAEPDRLWHLGKIRLLLGQNRAARDTLARAGRAAPGPWRRLLACALHLPGVCAIARQVARMRHVARHTTAPALPGRPA